MNAGDVCLHDAGIYVVSCGLGAQKKEWHNADHWIAGNQICPALTAGYTLCAYLTADGLVFVCGGDEYDQLGVGDKENRLAPMLLSRSCTSQLATVTDSAHNHQTISSHECGVLSLWYELALV